MNKNTVFSYLTITAKCDLCYIVATKNVQKMQKKLLVIFEKLGINLKKRWEFFWACLTLPCVGFPSNVFVCVYVPRKSFNFQVNPILRCSDNLRLNKPHACISRAQLGRRNSRLRHCAYHKLMALTNTGGRILNKAWYVRWRETLPKLFIFAPSLA